MLIIKNDQLLTTFLKENVIDCNYKKSMILVSIIKRIFEQSIDINHEIQYQIIVGAFETFPLCLNQMDVLILIKDTERYSFRLLILYLIKFFFFRSLSLYNFLFNYLSQFVIITLQDNSICLQVEELLAQQLFNESFYSSLLASDLWYFIAKFVFSEEVTMRQCCWLMKLCLEFEDYKFLNAVLQLNRLLPLLSDEHKEFILICFNPLTYSRIFKYLNLSCFFSIPKFQEIIQQLYADFDKETVISLDHMKLMSKLTSQNLLDQSKTREIQKIGQNLFLLFDYDDEIELFISIYESFSPSISTSTIEDELLILILRKFENIYCNQKNDNFIIDFTTVKLLFSLSKLGIEIKYEKEFSNIISSLLRRLMSPKRSSVISNFSYLTLLSFALNRKQSEIVKICSTSSARQKLEYGLKFIQREIIQH